MTASVSGSVCLWSGLRRWFWEEARIREYGINNSGTEDGLTCVCVSPMATLSSCLQMRLLLSAYAWEPVSIRGTVDSGTSWSIHMTPPGTFVAFSRHPYLSRPWLYTPYKCLSQSLSDTLMGSRCLPQGRRRHRNAHLFVPRTTTTTLECMWSRGPTFLPTWSSSGGKGDPAPHH